MYDTLSFLPKTDIEYDTVTSDRFFIHVHRLIKGKNHLHHSHVTGQILGYGHDFCNTTVIEKTKAEIPVIAQNVFGFDVFYFVKTFTATSSCSKKLNIGGTNLTHVNYGVLGNEIKLIDSMKYYQKSLAAFSSTLTQHEKGICSDFIENVGNHFSNIQITNFDMINNDLPKNKIQEYKTFDYESINQYPEAIKNEIKEAVFRNIKKDNFYVDKQNVLKILQEQNKTVARGRGRFLKICRDSMYASCW